MLSALAVGTYELVGALLPIARSHFSRFIAHSCWSDRAWSRILLLQTDSAPVIQHSLKFLRPLSFILNLVKTLHRSLVLPGWTSVSQSSHVTVWHSLSMSTFHFEKVAYMRFLFLASEANAVSELDAVFILTQFQ